WYTPPWTERSWPCEGETAGLRLPAGAKLQVQRREQLHPRRGGPEGALRAGARVPGVLRRPAHPPSALRAGGGQGSLQNRRGRDGGLPAGGGENIGGRPPPRDRPGAAEGAEPLLRLRRCL